jgi:hypothetical protein
MRTQRTQMFRTPFGQITGVLYAIEKPNPGVAGPIAAALAGAGAGAAAGGLIGALIGAGIPEERAAEYERGIREGGIVVRTRARDDMHAAELECDWGDFGGTSIRR